MWNEYKQSLKKMRLLSIIALLCTMAQGAWGQTVATEEDLTAAVSGEAPSANITLETDITLANCLMIAQDKIITLDLNGHTLKRSLSDADANGHVIEVLKGGTLTVRDDVGGGKLSGGRANNGGGICNYGTLYFEGGIVSDCFARETGGGIKNNAGATLTMSGGVILGCYGDDCGGIYNASGGVLIITGGSISGNTSGHGGGGVVNYGTATISGGTIHNNHATTRGGGIWNGGTLTLADATVTDNRADIEGGGIQLHANSTATLSSGIIRNNTSADGGGIYVAQSATADLTTCSLTGNTSTEHGGGGITNHGTISLHDATITGNACLTNGGGIWNGGTLNIEGNITVNANKRTGSADITASGTTTNIYLYTDRIVNVVGNLNDSQIGVGKQGNTGIVSSNLEANGKLGNFSTDNVVKARLTLDGDKVVLASWSGADAWTDTGNYSESFSHVEQSCIYIESEEELALMARKINAGEKLLDYTFYLNRDLNMGTHLWIPMGSYEHPAYVRFNGQGHIISGIHVDRPSEDFNGLFGCFRRGNLESIVLMNSYINGHDYTGGILGVFLYDYSSFTFGNFVSDAIVKGADYVGGIAGDPVALNMFNCLYLGNSVTGSSHVGALFGDYTDNAFSKNNYYTEEGAYVSNKDVRAYPLRIATTPDGVTISNVSTNKGLSFAGTKYVPSGSDLSLKAQYDKGIDKIISDVTVNGTAITDNGDGSYSGILQSDASTTQFLIDFSLTDTGIAGEGTEESPYFITTEEQWNIVGTLLLKGNSFSGKCLRLANDIQTSNMIGTQGHPFRGIFDGGNHKLKINYTATEEFCAPFYHVNGATIRNLRLEGKIYPESCSYAASIVGHSEGNTSLKACRSSVSLQATPNTNARIAGLAGLVNGGSLTIEGCVFEGNLHALASLFQDNSFRASGFVALAGNDIPVTITNSLFAPNQLYGDGAKTFVNYQGNGTRITISNSYYTRSLGTPQGKQGYRHSVPPVDLGSELTTYAGSGITAYENGLSFNGYYYNNNAAGNKVTLYDQADNSKTIHLVAGKKTEVNISGRTLYKDGSWNTLCLPFNLTLSGSNLDGDNVRLMTLGEASFSNGTLTLTFVNADEIEAGVPYIIKWDNTGNHIVDPVFTDVVFDNTSPDEKAVTNDVVCFKGIYSPFKITGEDNKLLYMGADNKLYHPSASMSIGAFRAFFELQGDLMSGETMSTGSINDFVLNFGDETNSIESLQSSIFILPTEGWFSTDGRRLNGKPTQKGIYIHNGRKVVIK